MGTSKIVTAVVGAIILILGATGICTAEEGTALSGHAGNVAIGLIGIVEIVNGIVGRKKTGG